MTDTERGAHPPCCACFEARRPSLSRLTQPTFLFLCFVVQTIFARMQVAHLRQRLHRCYVFNNVEEVKEAVTPFALAMAAEALSASMPV